MFTCPICSNNSCSIVSPEMPLMQLYKCDGCSVVFCNPEKFGKVKNINTGNKQIPMSPPIPGVVVSEPIKITRL